MSRWDICDRDGARETGSHMPPKDPPEKSGDGDVSVGRGPKDDASSEAQERPSQPKESRGEGTGRAHGRYRDRHRTYQLRESEIRALTDIGTFRTVDLKDLARYSYGGDEVRARREIDHLRQHGLVEQKTVLRAHKTPREMVTLTKEGHRLVRRGGRVPTGQRLYHGFVKEREINHDADLYKMYQQASEEIRQAGGNPTKVRLDFELKAAVQREKNEVKGLSKEEQAERLDAFAQEHGLAMRGIQIHVPDVQIEYETREGELERANLELVSENYRSEGIRSKADSGFRIYARGNDATRVRRALEDTRAVERILSL